MRALGIAAACLLLARLSVGECVTVRGADPGVTTFHLSSRRIRITTLQEGKTLENVRLLFYLTTDDVNPKLALTTDRHGVALGSDLAPGRYRVLAFGPEQESAGMYLEVKDKGGSRTSSFLLNIPPAFLPERVLDIDAAPITEHVRNFRGHAEDASGAAIAGALVQVYRKDSPSEPVAKIKADNNGSFAASLTTGKYVVFVSSPGFTKKVIGFEIGPENEEQDLRVELRVGSC